MKIFSRKLAAAVIAAVVFMIIVSVMIRRIDRLEDMLENRVASLAEDAAEERENLEYLNRLSAMLAADGNDTRRAAGLPVRNYPVREEAPEGAAGKDEEDFEDLKFYWAVDALLENETDLKKEALAGRFSVDMLIMEAAEESGLEIIKLAGNRYEMRLNGLYSCGFRAVTETEILIERTDGKQLKTSAPSREAAVFITEAAEGTASVAAKAEEMSLMLKKAAGDPDLVSICRRQGIAFGIKEAAGKTF